ncbi:MAG TPA: type 1 glutamine amidotransferase domain-containing protein [Polyangia bacterium]|jgi:putative intracellular protease/amidase|nr:type 1 glutamine amidotransferase domain-containing protein [Polyangia bacterium]
MSLRDPNVVNARKRKRVAIVIANPATSTTTGWPVGFWWAELTHAYYVFSEAGYEVELFSPDGGRCEADAMSSPHDPSGYSSSDLITAGFMAMKELAGLIERTRRVDDLDLARFDAIFVAGGQSPMFTFEGATSLQRKFVEFYESGRIAAALCHGVALLRYAKLSSGQHLAKGKTVTGFANVEEDFADNAVWGMNLLSRDKHVMPWRIEDELAKIGANYIQAGLWRSFAVRDGNLITGQQNFSGEETARLVVETLGR